MPVFDALVGLLIDLGHVDNIPVADVGAEHGAELHAEAIASFSSGPGVDRIVGLAAEEEAPGEERLVDRRLPIPVARKSSARGAGRLRRPAAPPSPRGRRSAASRRAGAPRLPSSRGAEDRARRCSSRLESHRFLRPHRQQLHTPADAALEKRSAARESASSRRPGRGPSRRLRCWPRTGRCGCTCSRRRLAMVGAHRAAVADVIETAELAADRRQNGS